MKLILLIEEIYCSMRSQGFFDYINREFWRNEKVTYVIFRMMKIKKVIDFIDQEFKVVKK